MLPLTLNLSKEKTAQFKIISSERRIVKIPINTNTDVRFYDVFEL